MWSLVSGFLPLLLCCLIVFLGLCAISHASDLAKKAATTFRESVRYPESAEPKALENIKSAVIFGLLGTYLMILGTLLLLK